MGVAKRVFCDLCRGEQGVAPMVVVRDYGKREPWEVDICEDCYLTNFAELRKVSRRPMVSNVRPQHRFRKIEITEANL